MVLYCSVLFQSDVDEYALKPHTDFQIDRWEYRGSWGCQTYMLKEKLYLDYFNTMKGSTDLLAIYVSLRLPLSNLHDLYTAMGPHWANSALSND